MIENISSESSKQLSDLADSELSSSTKSDSQNSRIEMQNENYSNANNLAKNAQSGLNQMLETSKEIQSQFQDETVKKMLRKLLALIQNLLYISKQQEKLISETQNLRSRSPKLIDSALKQDRILRQNQQLMNQLVELSKETFHISPQIASTIGRTKNAMDRTISQLEQKQTLSAKKEMKAILKGLIRANKQEDYHKLMKKWKM